MFFQLEVYLQNIFVLINHLVRIAHGHSYNQNARLFQFFHEEFDVSVFEMHDSKHTHTGVFLRTSSMKWVQPANTAETTNFEFPHKSTTKFQSWTSVSLVYQP